VAPTFGHAAETFLVAHTLPGAWSPGTAVKYRQTLTALAGRLVGVDLAALDSPAGAAELAAAFTAAFGHLSPATRVRHLSTLRSALTWWRETGWLAGWARPKVVVDTTRALTRDQVAEQRPALDQLVRRPLPPHAARPTKTITMSATGYGPGSR
jgi:hypothetical protein